MMKSSYLSSLGTTGPGASAPSPVAQVRLTRDEPFKLMCDHMERSPQGFEVGLVIYFQFIELKVLSQEAVGWAT